ncbi:putative endonuclease [Aquimarina sp. EL_43]|uniref:GIY-YIG nuclease family protein n=1 Tax=unclassified Aquimarina TaxID=2627091 RepID=UPI0018CA8DE6|nr:MULTISPECIES: GIY-YIG nuclease family protein [unclassified Aquimarina]MBG6132258.1 putative endonuclease [Aquimarina sp. EL_35]MBG6153742.1 putative endonuclease [Aquimarina sp. EL_32]MBG6171898.1 putative endonuclease [Aquimarina sp. EL_43]
MKYYYTYIVECSDGSFYTGMTNDLERRMNEHNAGNKPDSYTYNKRPVVLKWFEICTNPNEAIQIEKQVKGWSRRKKIALIEENWDKLVEYSKNYTQFGNNIDKNNGSSTGSD